MKLLGSRVARVEDPRLLTGRGAFVADVQDPLLEGAAHAVFVRSTVAHARLTGIDLGTARAMPGVLGVFTASDLDVGPVPAPVPLFPPGMTAPVLASERVRYVGEPVAVVVATSAAHATDAAEAVVVDYDSLPVVATVVQAATDDVLLFPDVGTNTAATYELGEPAEDLFARCDVVVSASFVNQRMAACPLEMRVCASVWHEGRLHHWLSVQAPHFARTTLARLFGVDPSAVRVIAPDVGGGFGPKFGCFPEDVCVAWAARHLGRAVRWSETRSESMVGLHHGRAQLQQVKIGGTRDGRVLAYALDILQDAGAYMSLGAYTASPTLRMTTGPYAIPHASARARAVVTNTTPVSAYRGAGRPEAACAIERAMDLYAAEIGMDAAEVRRRNLVPPDRFPYTTPVGTTYDTGEYGRALEAVLRAAEYEALRAEQARRRAAGDPRQLGIGVSVYVESTAGPVPGTEFARVEVHANGSATVLTGTSPHGQGHGTSWAMIASEQLGIAPDRVQVRHGDTDVVAVGGGTFGSRSLQLGGVAVHEGAVAVAARARELAAELLEAHPDDIVLDDGRGAFCVRGTPSLTVTWADVVDAAGDRGLAAERNFAPSAPTYPFGAHVAVVELDVETGAIRLVRHVALDDAGRIVNPVIAEGQRHGGIAQGVAQALLEEFRYDESANPLTTNLMDYPMISSAELVPFELVASETPTPINPLGAKGIGESGTIGSIPAVQSAVCDVLAPFGIRHLDLPATPERVWRALRDATGTSPRSNA